MNSKTLKRFCLGTLFIIPSCLMALSTQPHHTTAFIGQPGEIDCLVSYSSYSTNHFWNRCHQKLPTFNHFHRNAYLLYAEYALNRCNSLTLNGGFATVKESLNGNSYGCEDCELSWKSLLHREKTSALTLQILSVIPTGATKSSIRYGQLGLQASLLYSDLFTLFDDKGWYDLGIGYRYYQNFPSDQIRLDTAIGYSFLPFLSLIASAQLEYGLLNGKSSCNLNNVVLHPNYRLLNIQLECVTRVCSHILVTFGAFKHVWGYNSGAGGGFFGGAWFIF